MALVGCTFLKGSSWNEDRRFTAECVCLSVCVRAQTHVSGSANFVGPNYTACGSFAGARGRRGKKEQKKLPYVPEEHETPEGLSP